MGNYTAESEHLQSLNFYNRFVWLWLYIALIIVFTLFGLSNFLHRKLTQLYIREYGTSRRVKVTDQMGRTALRWIPDACLGWWRKRMYKRNKWINQYLGMDNAGQLGLVLGYYILVLSIALSGAQGKLEYQSRHCGGLFNANLPLLVGLASKELSFISWVTGFSFPTLAIFHWWIAALLFLLACIHIGGAVHADSPHVNPTLPHNHYQAWGIVAFVFFIVLFFSSGRWVRNRFSQIFMPAHIAAFLIALISLSIHRPQVSPFVIAALVLYFSDRMARAAFLVYYNFLRGIENPPIGTVEVLSDDTLRVVFRTTIKWNPGQHTFLHFPLLAGGGHPFPILSSPASRSFQVFLISVEESGLTQKLYKMALHNMDTNDRYPATSPIYPAWIERPRGGSLGLEKYETVCLLVEGISGISWAVGLVGDLAKSRREDGMVTKRVIWIWTVKELAHVEWISDNLREIVTDAPDDFIDFRIYLTNDQQELHADRRSLLSDSYEAGIGESQHNRISVLSEDFEARIGEFQRARRDAISLHPSTLGSTGHRSSSPTPADIPPEEHLPVSVSVQPASTSSHPRTSDDSRTLDRQSSFVSARDQVSLYAQSGEDSQQATIEDFPLPPSREGAQSDLGDGHSEVKDSGDDDSKWSWLTIGRPEHRISLPLFDGLPNTRELVEDAVRESEYSDCVFIGCCGPSKFMGDVGDAVSSSIDVDRVCMGEHRRNPIFHAEQFGW